MTHEMIREKLAGIRCFLLDMDGTFYLGDQLIEGSLDFLEALQRTGRDAWFLTNNSSKSASAYVEKLTRMAVPDPFRTQVMTSGHAAAHYLLERFPYKGDTSATPVHDALVGGIADPTGMAQTWKLICDRAGMTCHVVQGLQNGEPYVWNIVNVDGYYRHLDLPQCVLEHGTLVMKSDAEMVDYYWNTGIYPVCEPYPDEPFPEPQPEAQEPSNPEDQPAEPDPTPEETSPSSQEP